MQGFRFSTETLLTEPLRAELLQRDNGGYVSFEGWVRDHNDGRRVQRLEYEAFAPLALAEGNRIVTAARESFGIRHALCVHRLGALEIGDIAVWVGVSSPHRDEAFRACRHIIDEIKHRLPIWKKEYYLDGDATWVNCERCAAPAQTSAARAHEHVHDHEHRHAPAPPRITGGPETR